MSNATGSPALAHAARACSDCRVKWWRLLTPVRASISASRRKRQLPALDAPGPVAQHRQQQDQQHDHQAGVLRGFLVDVLLQLQHLVAAVEQLDLLRLLQGLVAHDLVGQLSRFHVVQIGFVGFRVVR